MARNFASILVRSSVVGLRSKRRRRDLALRPCVEALEGRIALATDTFINLAGGPWIVPTNWSRNEIPQPGDDVVIPTLAKNAVVGNVPVLSINSLTLDGKLNLDGSLTVANGVSGGGNIVLSGTLAGTTVGKGITIQGVGGTLDAVTLTGNMTITNNTNINITHGLKNDGMVYLGGRQSDGVIATGSLTFMGSQTLTGNGAVIATGDNNSGFGGGIIIESTKAHPGNTLTIGPQMTVEANRGGNLTFIGNVVLDGSLKADGFLSGMFFQGLTLSASAGLESLNDGSVQAGTLNNAGHITTDAGGQFDVLGKYTQSSTGTLNFLIHNINQQPSTSNVLLNVGGNVSLAGTLSVTYANGRQPTPGQIFPVIYGHGTRTGQFEHVVGGTVTYRPVPGIGPGVFLTISSLPDIAITSAGINGTIFAYTYQATGNPGPFIVGLYQSADTTFDPGEDPPISPPQTISPGSQGPGSFVLPWPFPLDATRPFLLVVADPHDASHPNGQILESNEDNNVAAKPYTPPYTPALIRNIYGINDIVMPWLASGDVPDGSGQTIAIISSYHNPNIYDDLDTFDKTFGAKLSGQSLYQQYGPAATFLSVTNQQLHQNSPLPDLALPDHAEWSRETILDIETVHAIAPGAKIILVECVSENNADHFAGVQKAISLPGVTVISMSWGGIEQAEISESTEVMYDSIFAAARNITFVAATGDKGSKNIYYPSTSPYVLAVGGTSLHNVDALGNYPGTGINEETAWSLGGGNESVYEPRPRFQDGLTTLRKNRTVPDVAFDADYATGFYTYDTYDADLQSIPDHIAGNPWINDGGVSFATPAWAALIAIANQGRVAAGGSPLSHDQLLQYIYNIANNTPSMFHDIVFGDNGQNSASSGYDLVTGLGTPQSDLLIPTLSRYGLKFEKLASAVSLTSIQSSTIESPYHHNLLVKNITNSAAITSNAVVFNAEVPNGFGTIRWNSGRTAAKPGRNQKK